MRTFGLIGKDLSHSFSQQYFQKKFYKEGIKDCQYLNFDINNISTLNKLIQENNIKGLNVTIPFKEQVIPFLDERSEEAKQVGAVNTIKICEERLIGYNTDIFGFENSLLPILKKRRKAIVLGNGGVSKAVQFVLKKNNINFIIISRSSVISFLDVSYEMIQENEIIINTTPLGMHPKTEYYPDIPYNALNSKHLLYDLVYNPKESKFLRYGKARDVQIKNGEEMLYLQAEESWKIWNI